MHFGNFLFIREYCKCGRKKKEHSEEALNNQFGGDLKWKVTDERCVRELPITGFGEIEFPNSNIAKVYSGHL